MAWLHSPFGYVCGGWYVVTGYPHTPTFHCQVCTMALSRQLDPVPFYCFSDFVPRLGVKLAVQNVTDFFSDVSIVGDIANSCKSMPVAL